VITYFAINLTNKKFQVGSATDFERRCKQHHSGKGDLEFQRSLRKNPENFYWVVGDDDGLQTREEEQYYLDFYHGTVWCYNHNPSASAPPSSLGSGGPTHHLYGKPQSEETKRKKSEAMLGEKNPFFGKNHTAEAKRRQSESMSGSNHPNFGKSLASETTKKISDSHMGRTGELSSSGKKCEIKYPDGSIVTYGSAGDASRDSGIPKSTLTRWARGGTPCGKYKEYEFNYRGSK
jgi:group I intron endonuclease